MVPTIVLAQHLAWNMCHMNLVLLFFLYYPLLHETLKRGCYKSLPLSRTPYLLFYDTYDQQIIETKPISYGTL